MQKINQKILSLLLALTMVVSLLSPVTNVSWAEDAAGNTVLKAGDTVTAGGNYTLSKDIAAGTIYISTTDPVTISGDGVTIDEKGQSTSDAYKNLKFDCSAVTGANLTLKDMFLEDRSDTSPLVNFAGLDNKLNFEGTVVMDKYGSGQGTYANIHVSLPWG